MPQVSPCLKWKLKTVSDSAGVLRAELGHLGGAPQAQ